MPTITGTTREADGEEDQSDGWEVVSVSAPLARPAVIPMVTPPSPANAPSSAKKFVTPISFYAKAPEKPKPKGPLLVARIVVRASSHGALDMIQVRKVRWS